MFHRRLLWGVFMFAFAFLASAQQSMPFKLVDGTVISGRPIAAKDQFVQVAMDAGGYTNLFWVRLSQDTLKALQENRTTAPFASAFIDPPKTSRATKAKKSITLQPAPRLDRPPGGGLFASPVMIVLLLLIYGANIYAAYEISVFRQQPPALVCVVAALVPIIGPAIFLAMPTRQPKEEHVVYEHVHEEVPVEEAPAPVVEEAPVVPQEPAAPVIPPPVVYPRGQFTFNRRFFETKFAGFLKVVPGDAERDKVIQIKSARGEYVGQRFSKVEPNEVYLQVRKGAASEDVMIPFSEIYEVTIKHKDA